MNNRNEPPPRILVVGVHEGGAGNLPAALVERITSADLLVGGVRHLSYFPAFRGERVTLRADMEPMLAALREALAHRKQAVVLGSGDPLFYGIGATLKRAFSAEVLEIIPAPTSIQLAFAALAEPWHNATFIYAVTPRPLAEVVADVSRVEKAAILNDRRNTPPVIAQALLAAGLAPDTPCAICENLAGPEQRVIRAPLLEIAGSAYADLNVFIVWNKERPITDEAAEAPAAGGATGRSFTTAFRPGLPDEAFSTNAGQITKREVRLLSLAELALGPGEILWDIGAGSGAVSIEAARMQPAATVYAVEQRSVMCEHARINLQRFPVPNVRLIEGTAPAACVNWPSPDAVFIGGSGGQLLDILDLIQQRLRPNGRLVMNLVTLDHLELVRARYPNASITQAQINRAVPILDSLRFEALNPVFIVTCRKDTRNLVERQQTLQ